MNGPIYKKELGQYFTIDESLQDKIIEFIKNEPKIILEPSFGKGHLLIKILQKFDNINYDCYEIDKDLYPPLFDITPKINIYYTDFLKANITSRYSSIIGNPPYIKATKCNLYLLFIEKSFNLLEENGELIFIVPSNFIKITSSSKIINQMCHFGSFTHFYFPHNEKLFQDANIDIMIFRYQKSLYIKTTNVTIVEPDEFNEICTIKNINNINGIITFSDTLHNGVIVKDLFDVFVGMVSGKEKVFKHDQFGNIEILNDQGKINRYIYIEKFPTGNNSLDNYLLSHKEVLLSRKIRKFNHDNWFEFGCPRNKKNIEDNLNFPCIYIRNLTRKHEVSFKYKTMYFGGSLICLIPKHQYLYEYLDMIVTYFNSLSFKENYLYSGRFKIGHKQIENILIPNDIFH